MTLPRPRRLTPPAPLGSLLKRFDAVARVKRMTTSDDPEYLALVRQCPCLYCGMDPCGEAAHVKFSSAAFGKANKLGKRPDDENALPLCGEDHRIARHAQHNHNEEAFWLAIGISPYLVAEKLYAQRGDLVAMRAVVMVAISERGK